MDAMIERVISREGGYVDDSVDLGGCTNFGITLATLRAYQNNPSLDCRDIQALRQEQAGAIYARDFLAPFAGVKNEALREFCLDSAVLHGVETAAKWLQHAVGAPEDGIVGPRTLAAVALGPAAGILAVMNRSRMLRYAAIVQERPGQIRFLAGWLSRLGGLLATCLGEL